MAELKSLCLERLKRSLLSKPYPELAIWLTFLKEMERIQAKQSPKMIKGLRKYWAFAKLRIRLFSKGY